MITPDITHPLDGSLLHSIDARPVWEGGIPLYVDAVLALNPLHFYRDIVGGVLVDYGRGGVNGVLQGGLAQDGIALVRGVASLKFNSGEYANFPVGDEIVGDVTVCLVHHLAAGDLPALDSYKSFMTHAAPGETQAANVTYSFGIRNEGGLIRYRYSHEHGAGINTVIDFTTSVITDAPTFVCLKRDTATKEVSLFVNRVKETPISYTDNPDGGTTAILELGASSGGNAHATNVLKTLIFVEDSLLLDDEVFGLYDSWEAERTEYSFPVVEVSDAVATESATGSTSLTVNYANNVVDGQKLYLCIGKDGTASDFAAISGWTAETDTINSGTEASMRVYSKVADSEPGTVVVSWGGGDSQRAHAVMVGVSRAGATLAVATSTGNTNDPACPDVAGTQATALLFYVADSGSVAEEDSGYPSEAAGIVNKSAVSSQSVSIGAASIIVPVGSVGAQEWTDTLSVAEQWIGATVLVDKA